MKNLISQMQVITVPVINSETFITFETGQVILVPYCSTPFIFNGLGLEPLAFPEKQIIDKNGEVRPETKEEKLERYDKMIQYYEFLKRNV